jgi:hypothetical protein
MAAVFLLAELYLLSRLLIAPLEGPVVRIEDALPRTAMAGHDRTGA